MRLWHMSGAGNDFVVADIRGTAPDLKNMAIRLCAQTGADGFMALDHSDTADFRMHFYNPSGLRGEMCGNGARCICKFAYDLGIAGPQMRVQTDAGEVIGWHLEEDRYRIRLNTPSVVDLSRKEACAYVELGDPGIPHVVVELPELSWEMAEGLRPRAEALRYDPAFPKGANVNFYTMRSADQADLLTYERGVEDYTLACGTGSASLAVALWHQGKLPGGCLTVHSRGGMLTVTLSGQNETVTDLFLEGPTVCLQQIEE